MIRIALLVLLFAAHFAEGRDCFLPAEGALHLRATFEHTTPSDDGFFLLHWSSTGDSASSVSQVGAVLEAAMAARDTYEGLPGAWQIPLGEREHYPIYLVRLGFPGATRMLGGGLSELLVASNMADFGSDALLVTRVTVAHELFHAFQLPAFSNGFDERDRAFLEASAVWAEDFTLPDADDWVTRYAPAFLETLWQPLSQTNGAREYGAAMVIKQILCDAGDTNPLLNTLLQIDSEHRAWNLFLAQSGDPSQSYIGAMTEILKSGQATLAGEVPCITELPLFPELAENEPTVLLPATAGSVDGTLLNLACTARRFTQNGSWSLQYDLAANPGSVALIRASSYQPEFPASGDTLTLGYEDCLLFCNASSVYADWSLSWERVLLSDAAIVAVWPNPGGCNRQLQLARPLAGLDVYNLLGQRLDYIPLAQTSGVQVIQLPPAAAGPLYLRAGDQTVPLLMQ